MSNNDFGQLSGSEIDNKISDLAEERIMKNKKKLKTICTEVEDSKIPERRW